MALQPAATPISSPLPKRRSSDRFGSERMITVILLAGLLARVVVALSRTDAVWPDEQFQSLEPAGYAVFGHGLLSWEWREAYRSWVIPAIYMPLFWLLKFFGVQGGLTLVLAGRLLTALGSSWALWRLAQSLQLLNIHRRARFFALAAIALAPSMILWAPATLADNWALIAALGILPSVIRQSRRLSANHDSPDAAIQLGLLFGLCFFLKPQMLFWGAGAGIALLTVTRSWRNVTAFSLGFATWILAHGAVDWITWGKPFQTIIEQFARGEKTSRFYGVAPWNEYFVKLAENQGATLFIALGALAVFSLFNRNSLRRWFRTQSRALPFVFWPSVALIAFLTLVPHKELRFLLPAVPFLYLALAMVMHVPFLLAERKLPHGSIWRASLTAALILLTIRGTQTALHTPVYLTPVDISRLEDTVYHLNGFFGSDRRCLLLVDHNWSWTRGQLVLGADVRHVERKLAEITAGSIDHCPFAIVPTLSESLFEARAQGGWQRIDRASSGFSLYLDVPPTRVPAALPAQAH